MAGGYSPPPSGDLGALTSEIRDLRKRVSELERPTGTQAFRAVENLQATITEQDATIAELAATVAQLNSAVVTDSQVSVVYSQGNLTTPVSDFDAVTVTFTRPVWATRATVLASGFILFGGTYNSPGGGTARLRVGGVDGPSTVASSPLIGDVLVAGVPNGDEAAIEQDARTLVHARTFDTAASTISVSHRINVGLFGAGSTMQASILATVFWSAP